MLFAVLVVGCLIAGTVAVVSGIRSPGGGDHSARLSGVLLSAEHEQRPTLVFRDLAADAATRGRLAAVRLDRPSGARTLLPMNCDRVYFAATVGLCVTRGHGFAQGYRAEVFGPDLRIRHSVPLAGLPSRARVSADGHYGTTTMFVTGHSYANSGQFSTQTNIIDLRSGRNLGNLEEFLAFRGQRRITAVDVNYWGVTFDPHDSDRFYATLATAGRTYLVRGSVRRRQVRVIHANVECPSISPDGTRIAYKKRGLSVEKPWHLTVLDLKTMRETPLSESRSVDDQVEWLDDRHVLYGVDGGVWEDRADGGGRPRLFAADAESPAVVRWATRP